MQSYDLLKVEFEIITKSSINVVSKTFHYLMSPRNIRTLKVSIRMETSEPGEHFSVFICCIILKTRFTASFQRNSIILEESSTRVFKMIYWNQYANCFI